MAKMAENNPNAAAWTWPKWQKIIKMHRLYMAQTAEDNENVAAWTWPKRREIIEM